MYISLKFLHLEVKNALPSYSGGVKMLDNGDIKFSIMNTIIETFCLILGIKNE